MEPGHGIEFKSKRADVRVDNENEGWNSGAAGGIKRY